MKKITLLLTGLILTTGLFAQTPVPAGDVSGTWSTTGSPYLIQGDIQIQQGATLTIEPGVSVEYQGNYRFLKDQTKTLHEVTSEEYFFKRCL